MPYRIGEVAERANVPEDFVRQLIDLGALPMRKRDWEPRRSAAPGCCTRGRRRGSRSRRS
jgi:hypothetical protein